MAVAVTSLAAVPAVVISLAVVAATSLVAANSVTSFQAAAVALVAVVEMVGPDIMVQMTAAYHIHQDSLVPVPAYDLDLLTRQSLFYTQALIDFLFYCGMMNTTRCDMKVIWATIFPGLNWA